MVRILLWWHLVSGMSIMLEYFYSVVGQQARVHHNKSVMLLRQMMCDVDGMSDTSSWAVQQCSVWPGTMMYHVCCDQVTPVPGTRYLPHCHCHHRQWGRGMGNVVQLPKYQYYYIFYVGGIDTTLADWHYLDICSWSINLWICLATDHPNSVICDVSLSTIW